MLCNPCVLSFSDLKGPERQRSVHPNNEGPDDRSHYYDEMRETKKENGSLEMPKSRRKPIIERFPFTRLTTTATPESNAFIYCCLRNKHIQTGFIRNKGMEALYSALSNEHQSEKHHHMRVSRISDA